MIAKSENSVSRRTERVGSLIRSVIADAILNRLSDPRIPTITSITRVDVAEDFTVARVHVSVFAPAPQQELCITALQSAAGRLRRELAPQLHLRKLPQLQFRLDDSVQRSFETVQRIDGAMRELGEIPDWERTVEDDACATADDRDASPSDPPAAPPMPDHPRFEEDA
jgi:ribosome-binding factor A